MKNHATAVWRGNGSKGAGSVLTRSKVLNNVPFSYSTRIEEGRGTNPEEMIASAHAGCFSMKLAFVLEAAGYTAKELNVDCEITFEAGKITNSHLTLKASIPNIQQEEFNDLVADAKENCPISLLLNTTMTIESELV
jgi:osmotically inducible protein OsmC